MPVRRESWERPSRNCARSPSARRGAALLLAMVLLGLLPPGCASRPTPREALQAASPLTRAEGVVRLAENGDPDAVAALVEMLEDPDRGVRLFAIVALRRLCGEDFGYRYYQTAPERESSIEAWREALREGRVRVRKTEPTANGRRAAAPERAVSDVDPDREAPGADEAGS